MKEPSAPNWFVNEGKQIHEVSELQLDCKETTVKDTHDTV